MLHEAAGMNLPEVRMRVLKRRRDPAAVNSRLIRRPIQRMFWLFLLPMTAAFCIGFVYPFLKGLFLSFCKFKTTSKWTWVGLSNYVKAFHDESFLYSFGYTAVFAIVSLIIINVLASTAKSPPVRNRSSGKKPTRADQLAPENALLCV